MGLTRRQLVARGALGGLVLTGAGWAFPSSSARLQSESGRMLNLVANPRAKRSLDGWDALVPGRDAPGLRAAGDGGAALVLAPGVAFGGIRIGRGDAISCTPGDILWVQADAKAVAAGNGSALSLTVGFSAGGRDLGDLELQVEESVESDRWYTLRGFSAVPPDADRCDLGVWLRSTRAGATVRATKAMIVARPPTVPDYFDGDSPDGVWTGTPHASASSGPLPEPVRPARSGFLAGWNDNSVTQSGLSVARDMALNEQIGMTVLRCGVDIRGDAWQAARGGRIDWSQSPGPAQIAELSDACHRHGIKFLPAVLGAPDWMSTAHGQIAPPRADAYGDWGELVAQIVRRLRPSLAAIELWNEPNLVDFWYPAADPRAYAALVDASAPAVRAAAPGVAVLSGGISGVAVTGGGNVALADYLGALYSGGTAHQFDGLSFHPYPEEADTQRFDTAMRAVRGALASAGHDVPLWVTEIGISTTGGGDASVTEDQQATIDRLLYAMLKRERDVQAVCWHTSVPATGVAPDDRERGYAFVDSDGRRKPVFFAIRAELAGEHA